MRALNRINMADALREILRTRFRSYADAARALGINQRELSRLMSHRDARAIKHTSHVASHVKLLRKLGYEVVFEVQSRSPAARAANVAKVLNALEDRLEELKTERVQ